MIQLLNSSTFQERMYDNIHREVIHYYCFHYLHQELCLLGL